MHFHNISNNDTFDMTSTMKYAVIFIPSHPKLRTKRFFPSLWDTKILV